MTIFHQFGDALRSVLKAIPLPVVRVLFVASLGLVLLWVLRLPRSETTPESGTGRWDENLKYTAAAALGIQIVIYCWL
jgi:hypothetical protein